MTVCASSRGVLLIEAPSLPPCGAQAPVRAVGSELYRNGALHWELARLCSVLALALEGNPLPLAVGRPAFINAAGALLRRLRPAICTAPVICRAYEAAISLPSALWGPAQSLVLNKTNVSYGEFFSEAVVLFPCAGTAPSMPYAAAGPAGAGGGGLAAGIQVQMQVEAPGQQRGNAPQPGDTEAMRNVSVPIPGGFITGRFDGQAPSQEEFSQMLGFMTAGPLLAPQLGQARAAGAQAQAQAPQAGPGVVAQAQTPQGEPATQPQPPQQRPAEAEQAGSADRGAAAGGSPSPAAAAGHPALATLPDAADSEMGGPQAGTAGLADPAPPASPSARSHSSLPGIMIPDDSSASDDGSPPPLQPGYVRSRCSLCLLCMRQLGLSLPGTGPCHPCALQLHMERQQPQRVPVVQESGDESMQDSEAEAMPALLASDSSDSEPAGLMTDEEDDGDWRTEDGAEYRVQGQARTCLTRDPTKTRLCCYLVSQT